jgi:hypothetical protein
VAPGETITIVFWAKLDPASGYCDITSANDANDPDISVPDGNSSVVFNYTGSCGDTNSATASETINPTQPDIDMVITPSQQSLSQGDTASWAITL